jgi:aromatic ring-opening dioxygenase catalytic subunit (LigB family)
MRRMLATLETSLARMPAEIGTRPKAVLMISGHWEAPDFAVMSSPHPPMVYDYSGFPAHTYQIKYSAPGAPDVAARAYELIKAAGLPSHLDAEQGFDHGTFAPMQIMYPLPSAPGGRLPGGESPGASKESMPLFQVSLKHGYDVAAHLALGRALAPLRSEGILIVGSGLSYHNLRLFGPGAKTPSAAFDAWLGEALAADPVRRVELLKAWETAPSARVCHPQEDHLVPLFAAVGAAEGERATRVYHDANVFGGVTASSWRFG